MKKSIWVVIVDNYNPPICKFTLPTIEAYSKRIGAEFNLIKDRVWPNMPAPYEKLQVHKLGKDSDWNIIIDADMFIHETMPDPTTIMNDFYIGSWMAYDADAQFPCDNYFYRDHRRLGVSTNFLFVPKACHDAFIPFDEAELEDRLKSIKRQFILDEYCISRNVAKYGLKHCGILKDLAKPPFKHFNSTSGHESHT